MRDVPKELGDILEFKGVRPQVIGSASDPKIKYPSDIDTQMIVKNVDTVAEAENYFKGVFSKLRRDVKRGTYDFIFIEFKAGKYNGQGLRWLHDEIINGVKVFDHRDVSFRGVFGHHSIIKLDLVIHEPRSNTFTEFSCNYYFIFKNGSRTFTIFEDDEMKKLLLFEHAKLMYAGNVFKALKRLYSYYKFIKVPESDPRMTGLVDLFNSELGREAVRISELKTMIEVIQSGVSVKGSKSVPQIEEDVARLSEELNAKTVDGYSHLLIPVF
jgi:hypothetical protein